MKDDKRSHFEVVWLNKCIFKVLQTQPYEAGLELSMDSAPVVRRSGTEIAPGIYLSMMTLDFFLGARHLDLGHDYDDTRRCTARPLQPPRIQS